MATIMDGVRIGFGIFIVLPLIILFVIFLLAGSETAFFIFVLILAYVVIDLFMKKYKRKNTTKTK